MSRSLREMTIKELEHEVEAWHEVIRQPKGPGTPSNSAREAAENYLKEADAWIARRRIEAGAKP